MAGLALAGPLAVDANLLGYLYLGEDRGRQAKARGAFAAARPFHIQVSTLAVSELLVRPQMIGGARLSAQVFGTLITTPGIHLVALEPRIARLAAAVRVETRLRLPDAIVLATAMARRADLLLTNDRKVHAAASGRVRAIYFDDWEP